MEALTGRTVCLVCSLHRCIDDHPPRLKTVNSMPPREVGPQGPSLLPNVLICNSSVMSVKINPLHPFLGHRQNQLWLQDTTGTPLCNTTSLLLNSPSFSLH